jgi:hypothetical protein
MALFPDWIVPVCISYVTGGVVGALLGVLIVEFLDPIDCE